MIKSQPLMSSFSLVCFYLAILKAYCEQKVGQHPITKRMMPDRLRRRAKHLMDATNARDIVEATAF